MSKISNYIIFSLLLIFLCPLLTIAQNQTVVDSLVQELKSAVEDTNKVIILGQLCNNLARSNSIKALEYGKLGLELAERSNDKKGIASSLNNIGIIEMYQGNYEKSIKYYTRSINLFKELNNIIRVSKGYGNIGVAYYYLGEYEKSINYQLKSLKIKEELGDTGGIASTLMNIGNIYVQQKEYAHALNNFTKSMELFRKLGDKVRIANNLNNIATIFLYQKNYEEAIAHNLQSLKIREEIEDMQGVSMSLNNLGVVYENMQDHQKALEYYTKSFRIDEEMGDKNGMGTSLVNIGIINRNIGNYDEAIEFINRGLKILKEIGLKENIKEGYKILSKTYFMGHNYKNAYEYFELYSEMKDSLLNEKNSKQIAEMEAKYETEKKELQIENLNKEKKLQNTELKKNRIMMFAFAGGFALALVLALVIFRGYRQKKKAKEIIEAKNKNITDSIRYAQNIQNAILPREAEMNKALPEHFIFFQPKDIVSGDFYWFHALPPSSHEEGGPRGVVAVCDCTGHGVPGAFVSMIGNDLLNKIIIEKGLENPGEILTELNNGVKSVFTSKETGQQVKDGMDMALISLKSQVSSPKPQDKSPRPQDSPLGSLDLGLGTWDLQYAGANNPLILIQNGKLSVIKGDKTAIGGDTDINYAFNEHKIKLKKGDTLYMFSDGYKDQFGGNTGNGSASFGSAQDESLTVNGEYGEGKKFMTKRFKGLLLSIHDKTMQEQKEVISKTIADWKGNLAQTDDICVIGVRV